MDERVYFLELEGRQVGPYDRRTIVGMRIKGTLGDDHALLGDDGSRLVVADLVKREPKPKFNPASTGSYSTVQATYQAMLVGCEGPGPEIPDFKGEVEARVQMDVVRIAGRFRQGLGWKEDRVKLPLEGILHARVRGNEVDFWVRHGAGEGLQRVTLDLLTPEAAGEFVDWLPKATPWPGERATGGSNPGGHPMVWGAVVGTVVAVAAVLVWVFVH